MSARFRKKPVLIEAVQWTGENIDEVERFMGLPVGGLDMGGTLIGRPWLAIPTLEGVHEATMNDWIIRGVRGEFYPCKPDIFAETYEPVEVPGVSGGSHTERLAEQIKAEIRHEEVLPDPCRGCIAETALDELVVLAGEAERLRDERELSDAALDSLEVIMCGDLKDRSRDELDEAAQEIVALAGRYKAALEVAAPYIDVRSDRGANASAVVEDALGPEIWHRLGLRQTIPGVLAGEGETP